MSRDPRFLHSVIANKARSLFCLRHGMEGGTNHVEHDGENPPAGFVRHLLHRHHRPAISPCSSATCTWINKLERSVAEMIGMYMWARQVQPRALTSCSFPSPFRLSERWRSPVRASRRSPCMHPPSVRPGHMYYALVRFYFYSRG